MKGDFEVAPQPEFEGGGRAGILGGHNLVISAFSKNPGGAVALIDFLTAPETLERDAAEYGLAPPTGATYDAPAVREALPFATELEAAVAQARSLPVTPVYSPVSRAIYVNVNRALTGRVTPEEALRTADREINEALANF